MPLPIVYRTGGDAVINYDFADVVSGTGFITLYPHAADEGTTPTITYQAVRQTVKADPGYTRGTTTSSSFVKVVDVDFDFVLDKPLTLSGKCLVEVPSAGNSNGTCHRYVNAIIRKWDGSTETDVAESRGRQLESGSGWSYSSNQLVIEVPETHFKTGDSIRITLEGWARKFASATTVDMEISHNPYGSDYGGVSGLSSASTLHIPLRLDL